jgi:hypothetical protein
MKLLYYIFELYSEFFNSELFSFGKNDSIHSPFSTDFHRLIYFYCFEQTANSLFFVPNEYIYSIWSQLHIPIFISKIMLFLIWSPLLFSILILWIYLRNLYKNLNFAHIYTIEQNEILFPIRDLKTWFTFY